jgi:molybdopterin-containing oxidoreductase family iron-sulfur binding subunit
MDESRRTFLKIAGLSALGLAAKPLADAAAAESGQGPFSPDPKVLTAKRWAMVVNVKKFKEKGKEALQRCIDACHSAHNVPELPDVKDQVKWLWTEPLENAFPEQEREHLHDFVEKGLNGLPVLVLCNHCDNPPCVRVCPTQATWRREDGIIMMDMHRCIGCRYCMAACPFGARSLNWRDPRPFIKTLNREYPTRTRGVVEKCTFCTERLAKGLMPACVEACKDKELVFGDLEDPNSEVREILRTDFAVRRKPQLGTRPQVYYIL